MKVDDALHGISTLITVATPSGQSQGTGFFYQVMAPPEKPGQPGWRAINQLWLVTNRHVLLPNIGGNEILPDAFTFRVRRISDARYEWEPIVLDRAELFRRARFHPNPTVDVAAVEVLDLMTQRLAGANQYQNFYAVSAEQLPGNNHIDVEATDDAIVFGYPRGFYDEHNVFPLVKSGIIASRWGAPFNGQPYFLIDAKLYPGSSGSVVISRPREMAFVEGKILYSKEKQFAFLGIFSGEPYLQQAPIEFDDMTIVRKTGFNVGIVWYGYLVDQIINTGVQITLS